MRILDRALRAAVTACLASALWAGAASAQSQLKLDQVGAALALPLWGDESGTRTFATVTNVGPVDRNLHFNVINGQGGWEVVDFDCPVTASETLSIRWEEGEIAYRIIFECNQATGQPLVVSREFDFREGILFVTNEAHECKDGTCTTNENDLFGDFVILNAAFGVAYSGGAIPFQGQDPLAPGVADRDYLFDNSEYSMFPATLASNFLAPGNNTAIGATVISSLILFTLDGRANVGSRAALDVVFYDDEETPTSAHYSFDCFAALDLTTIDPNFDVDLLGSPVGHFYMTVVDADQASNVHDNKFGNGNGIRVVGVHGWLLQGIAGPGGFDVFTRTLSQGMLPQDLDGNDVPAFDGL